MRIHRDTSTGFGKILNLPRFHFAVRNHSKRTRTRIQAESSDEKTRRCAFHRAESAARQISQFREGWIPHPEREGWARDAVEIFSI